MARLFAFTLILLFSGLSEAKLSVGDPAPFRLGKNAKGGEEIILQDYTGKITVVHFWASWCDYCFKSLPAMEYMQEQLGLANLQVISIAVKDEPKTVNKITAELKDLSMVSGVDKAGKVMESFGDDYMPNVWIIGRDGRISAQTQVKNDDDLKKAIKLVEAAIRAK
ncbi:TlpA disulfide reductase family protein [Arenimonas sp. GDDSR-1]|uniref:TlpA family protein disulfide reductase n=1 Tax=Arenimonas sp. GDDSR-1 TaxID=2950125 RepID=UPI00260955EA|nr:TlpA disulfide reductase family protein [Arenimonas sp. GDDSR-1]